jgi:hypothetical protein
MNFEELRYQNIEGYLKGNLSSQERIAFENQLTTDKELAQEVAVQKVAIESLEMAYIKSMSDLVKNRVQKNNTAKKYWSGGSAILVTTLLIGSAYLVTTNNNINPIDNKNTNKETVSVIDVKKVEPFDSAKNEVYKNEKTVQSKVVSENPSATSMSPMADTTFVTKAKLTESIQKKQSEIRNPETNETVIQTIPNKQAVMASNTKPISTVAPCTDKAPEISVRVNPTSFDEESGSISVSTPINWLVYIKGINSSYENKNQFNNIAAGTYSVYVKNENNCTYKIGDYTVSNSNCSFEKNYVFNKQYDKQFSIPTINTMALSIRIINKGGTEVYSEDIPAFSNSIWNGLNKNGEYVAIGLHKVIVTYSDNKTCIYNVVVSE